MRLNERASFFNESSSNSLVYCRQLGEDATVQLCCKEMKKKRRRKRRWGWWGWWRPLDYYKAKCTVLHTNTQTQTDSTHKVSRQGRKSTLPSASNCDWQKTGNEAQQQQQQHTKRPFRVSGASLGEGKGENIGEKRMLKRRKTKTTMMMKMKMKLPNRQKRSLSVCTRLIAREQSAVHQQHHQNKRPRGSGVTLRAPSLIPSVCICLVILTLHPSSSSSSSRQISLLNYSLTLTLTHSSSRLLCFGCGCCCCFAYKRFNRY